MSDYYHNMATQTTAIWLDTDCYFDGLKMGWYTTHTASAPYSQEVTNFGMLNRNYVIMRVADDIQAYVEEQYPSDNLDNFYQEMFNTAMGEVYWKQIAEFIVSEIELEIHNQAF